MEFILNIHRRRCLGSLTDNDKGSKNKNGSILVFPRDGTSRCPLVPGQKIFLVPMSRCPVVPGQGQEQMSRDKLLCPGTSRDKITCYFQKEKSYFCFGSCLFSGKKIRLFYVCTFCHLLGVGIIELKLVNLHM